MHLILTYNTVGCNHPLLGIAFKEPPPALYTSALRVRESGPPMDSARPFALHLLPDCPADRPIPSQPIGNLIPRIIRGMIPLLRLFIIFRVSTYCFSSLLISGTGLPLPRAIRFRLFPFKM
jgi:hypothetical protein